MQRKSCTITVIYEQIVSYNQNDEMLKFYIEITFSSCAIPKGSAEWMNHRLYTKQAASAPKGSAEWMNHRLYTKQAVSALDCCSWVRGLKP